MSWDAASVRRLCAGLVAGLVLAAAAPSTAGAKPGDVIVGDSGASTVLRLKPSSGDISTISDDPRLVNPNDSVFGANGKLYVADYDGGPGNSGAVFQINPKTGKTGILAKGAPLEQPDGIALGPNGDLFVTDITANGGSLFRVKVPSGDVKLVSDSSFLGGAIGVVVPSDGKPIVEGNAMLARVFPKSGNTDALTGIDYTGGDGLTRAPDGTLYAVDTSQSDLLAIDPATGDVTTAAPDALSDNYGLAIDFKGRVLTQASTSVYRVDPVLDTTTPLSDQFGYPEGLEVEPPTCEGRTATIIGSEGKDKLKGLKYDDVIAGLGGKDEIDGGGGDDRICGGSGGDDINGGAGHDRCDGGPGRDHEHSC